MSLPNSNRVSVQWLQKNLNNPKLIILDGTLAAKLKDVPVALQNQRIKGSRYFDIKNNFSNTADSFPSAFPSTAQFEAEAQNLGINNDSILVCYDANGIYSSVRVWWLLKTMGHQNCYVLDGGLPEWVRQNHGTETIPENPTYKKGNFKVNLNAANVRFFKDIQENVKHEKELVIDVRSKARFLQEVPEPRAGLRRGTIPNSINIPFSEVLNNGTFKTNEELQTLFQAAGIQDQKLVFSCGSGITACIVFLAAYSSLKNTIAVYDGSWTEWGTKTEA